MKISGIYNITNIINDKIYCGSSHDIKHRWYSHRADLRRNKHSNIHLQRSWNQYGELSFKFDIVEECPIDRLQEREQYHLDIAKQEPDKFYNMAIDVIAPARGYKHSEETKRKLHDMNVGENGYWFGKKASKETKDKQSLARKGKPSWASTHKEEMSKIQNGNQYGLGYKHTQDHKNKISKLMIGNDYGLDKTIYTFKHKITNEIFTGIARDFYKKYDLCSGHISRLLNGKKPQYKGWTLCSQ